MTVGITPLEVTDIILGFTEKDRFMNAEGNLVVLIGQRKDSSYTYAAYYWDMSEWQDHTLEGWSPGAVGGIYGSLEIAKNEALQFLKTRSWHNAI